MGRLVVEWKINPLQGSVNDLEYIKDSSVQIVSVSNTSFLIFHGHLPDKHFSLLPWHRELKHNIFIISLLKLRVVAVSSMIIVYSFVLPVCETLFRVTAFLSNIILNKNYMPCQSSLTFHWICTRLRLIFLILSDPLHICLAWKWLKINLTLAWQEESGSFGAVE